MHLTYSCETHLTFVSPPQKKTSTKIGGLCALGKRQKMDQMKEIRGLSSRSGLFFTRVRRQQGWFLALAQIDLPRHHPI